MQTLRNAYRKLFHKNPNNLKEWQIVTELISHLDPRVLGEELSRWLCWFSVCCTNYPNGQVGQKVIRHALDIASELFEEYSNRAYAEPHVAELEWIGNKRGYNLKGYAKAA